MSDETVDAGTERFEIVERSPLYAGSDGHRFVVVDAGSGAEIRTFRDRALAGEFVEELRSGGLAGWQAQNIQRLQSQRENEVAE